ncbi:MAG: crossover junction endodeoxyribonuclease RuvC [Candidatus Margulisbacteria bacterium]|nr:crossover junction endodeoxyribonuclease RuvC [Candidatus Margulisiibacteriota bacterium]
MLTLGIDPGSAITGFGLLEETASSLKIIDYGCIKTSPKYTAHERLHKLHEGIKKLIKEYAPDVMAVEKLFFCNNAKTAVAVGQARGVILLSAGQEKIKLAEYTPLEVKLAVTGYGKADKRQVQHMVKALLGLAEIPKPDDAADALAIAICHINSYKLKEKS